MRLKKIIALCTVACSIGASAVYDRIVSRCNDCGVFIDINAGGIMWSSIYGAWGMSTY